MNADSNELDKQLNFSSSVPSGLDEIHFDSGRLVRCYLHVDVCVRCLGEGGGV